MKPVNIYIDTSIKGPRRGSGTCLYILAYEAANGKIADAGDRLGREDATESQLTLLGLETALRRLKNPCHVVLYLECPYVAAALQNRWYKEWRYHGWMTAKAKPVRDAELWQGIDALLDVHTLDVWLKKMHPYREWMHRELVGASAANGGKGRENGKEHHA